MREMEKNNERVIGIVRNLNSGSAQRLRTEDPIGNCQWALRFFYCRKFSSEPPQGPSSLLSFPLLFVAMVRHRSAGGLHGIARSLWGFAILIYFFVEVRVQDGKRRARNI